LAICDFKTFKVKEFNKKKNYKSFKIKVTVSFNFYFNPFEPVSGEVKADVERFVNDLELVSTSVYYKLEIKNQIDYLYTYKLVEAFNCVSNLNLSFCHIPLNLLQFILSNLNLLILKIHKNAIYIDNKNYAVNLPQTLVKLDYLSCYAKLVKNKRRPIKIDKQKCLESESLFLLDPQYLPNLKYFIFTGFYMRDTTNFDRFLALNPQLKSININQDFLHKSNLEVISSNNQLERIEIGWHGNLNFPKFKYPILNSLKSLSCYIFDRMLCTFNLIPYCPNLEYLSMDVKFMYLANRGIRLAKSLNKLKKIVMNLYQRELYVNLQKFPLLVNLEEIVFNQFNPDKINFKSLEKTFKVEIR
jgi:hypothetical protein